MDKFITSQLPTTNPTVTTFEDAVFELARPTPITITTSTTISRATHANSVITISGSNNIVVTLDSAVGFNSRYIFNVDANYTGVFKIATVSSQTIQGSIFPQQFYKNEVFTLYSNNSNWVVM